MAVEDTPWFIGAAGVLHPAEAARAVAYAAANGSDGVIGLHPPAQRAPDHSASDAPSPSSQ